MINGGIMCSSFPFSLDNKRYHTWNYFLKTKFGKKVYKVPLSLANTCPNRDGTKGVGGCTFCLSGGGGTPYIPGSFIKQFQEASAPLEAKWPDSLTMPYFQSYSNTYLSANTLRAAMDEAISLPRAVGLCLATRPDCLSDDIIDILCKFSSRALLIVELGLQTIHEKTARQINRGHSYEEFVDGYNKLVSLNIPVCVHLINGLPYETVEMMLETAKTVASLKPHSVKFHMMHVLSGTKMAEEYSQNPFPLLSMEEYVQVVCSQIELFPPETVIQRVTGDPPKDYLIDPKWTLNKLLVRNSIDKELAKRDSLQGMNFK